MVIVNTNKRKKKKENDNDNKDVICVEHIDVKSKQQTISNDNGSTSPKKQEHSIAESEDRFVKFEFKTNSFHN